MDELIAWLGRMLDEDEAAAKEAAEHDGPDWHVEDDSLGYPDESRVYGSNSAPLIYDEGVPTVQQSRHIARHDPARVLREVAAKRRVLAWYADCVDASQLFREKLGTGSHMAAAAESYANVIKGYAAVYSDRDGYKAEWAPPGHIEGT